MTVRYGGTLSVAATAQLAARIEQHRNGDSSHFCKRYGLSRLVWAERGETILDCTAA